MKKSIGDNMIPKGWSFERGLELVKKSGWDGIELWLGDVPWFQMETTDAQVTELRRKVENAGLVVSNVSTGLHWETPLSSRDPAVRAKAIRIVERIGEGPSEASRRREDGPNMLALIDNYANWLDLQKSDETTFKSYVPDGVHLVFTSKRGNSTQIYTMLADGSNVQQLTTQGNNIQPVWANGVN